MSEPVEVVPVGAEPADAVDAAVAEGTGGALERRPDAEPAIAEPGKLMRIAVMLREVQDEARRAPTDEAGRDRLRRVHERALSELCAVLSPALQEELSGFTLPFGEGTPSEPEILIAQASLLGWLEGLFQGIQAAIFTQQLQAKQQLAGMRQPGLPSGAPSERGHGTGQYL